MPFIVVAHSESQDLANALGNVAAVADDTHNTSGDFLYISQWPNLIGYAAFAGTTGVQAQLQAPSLRRVVNIDIAPVFKELAPTSHDQVHLFPESPVPLVTNDGLEALMLADPAAAEQGSVVSFLSDGAIAPVQGEIFTIRATASITATIGAWTSGSLTFGQTLPSGRYQIVGARAEGTNLVAIRFVLLGNQGWRPGCIAVAAADDREHPLFRRGGLGVWGEFDNFAVPALEVLASGANTSQTIYLDIIKVS